MVPNDQMASLSARMSKGRCADLMLLSSEPGQCNSTLLGVGPVEAHSCSWQDLQFCFKWPSRAISISWAASMTS